MSRSSTAAASAASSSALISPPAPSLDGKRIHRRQLHEWDCGVACVYSLLLHLGAPTLRYSEVLDCVQPCEQRVWTIDLALLLHAFGVRGLRMRVALSQLSQYHRNGDGLRLSGRGWFRHTQQLTPEALPSSLHCLPPYACTFRGGLNAP
jgi:hypothetical protein